MSDIKPIVTEIKKGTHQMCQCHTSDNLPYCDGSHVGTGYQPLKLEQMATKREAICQCGYSGDLPFCDGSHEIVK